MGFYKVGGFLFVLMGFFGNAWCANETAGNLIPIEQVQLAGADSSMGATIVQVPTHIPRSQRALITLQAAAEFDIAEAQLAGPWMFYTEKLQDGGSFTINSTFIGGVEMTTRDVTVRRMQPHAWIIPDGVLKQGKNKLVRTWAVHENIIILPKMWLGPVSELQPQVSERKVGYLVLPMVTGVFSIVLALVLFSIYWKNRELSHYLWVAASAIGFSLVNTAFWVTSIPAWLYGYWQLAFFAGSSALTLGSYFYVLFACGVDSRLYRRSAVAVSILHNGGYLLLYWVTGLTHFPDYTRFGALLSAVFTIYPFAALIRGVWNRRGIQPWILLTLIGVGISINLLEAASTNQSGKILSGTHLLQPFVLVWFLVLCLLLIRDFTAALRDERALAITMSNELALQAVELSRLHALDSATQEDKATALERSRIMQDMHDGLGSQLVSSLAMARAGELSSTQTYELLSSCIDDLRLAIDTSQDTEDSLLLALGNLRFRMQPRLKAAGITLHWKTQTLSNPLPLRPQHQLPVLRIIQESLTNALKHANAKTITVEASNTETELTVRIEDDGQGFDVIEVRKKASGKGLNSLDKRARTLNAQLQVSSSALGSCIVLVLPLERRKLLRSEASAEGAA